MKERYRVVALYGKSKQIVYFDSYALAMRCFKSIKNTDVDKLLLECRHYQFKTPHVTYRIDTIYHKPMADG